MTEITEQKATEEQVAMIEKFQCPGCTCGMNIECGNYDFHEKDGYLFVRVMSPRINYNYVDVIKGGKFADICPNAINVGEFYDEID